MKITINSRVLSALLFVLAMATTFAVQAQSTTQEANYTAENEGWLVNLEEAYQLHQETGKPIMANFTGSDWCGWCKRLTASVFSKKEFQTWADDNVILLELDFPRRKRLPADIRKQNQQLQQAFNVRGYPSVWVFDLSKDAAGKFEIAALGKTGYAKTVGEFTGACDKMIAQREKTKSGE